MLPISMATRTFLRSRVGQYRAGLVRNAHWSAGSAPAAAIKELGFGRGLGRGRREMDRAGLDNVATGVLQSRSSAPNPGPGFVVYGSVP